MKIFFGLMNLKNYSQFRWIYTRITILGKFKNHRKMQNICTQFSWNCEKNVIIVNHWSQKNENFFTSFIAILKIHTQLIVWKKCFSPNFPYFWCIQNLKFSLQWAIFFSIMKYLFTIYCKEKYSCLIIQEKTMFMHEVFRSAIDTVQDFTFLKG